MRHSALLLAALLLTPLTSVWAQPPSVPTAIPPKGKDQAPAKVPDKIFNFPLKSGWNAVSFPFAQVAGTRGFPHALVDAEGKPIDPAAPKNLKPGAGYWAYSEVEKNAVAWGSPLTHATAIDLKEGWNLIGSPYTQDVEVGQITLSDGIQVNRIWEEVLPRWMLPSLYSPSPDNAELSLNEADALLKPGKAYWARAFKPVTWRINQDNEIPRITAFRPLTGGQWAVEGSNFGTAAEGRLVLDNHSASMLKVQQWTANRIVLTPPPSFAPHQITVVAGGAASPRVPPSTWQKRWRGVPGLAIRVVNEANEPVSDAVVTLDGWKSTRSNARGWVRFENVETGNHRVRISKGNYLTLDTCVQMAGQFKRTRAKLNSPQSGFWLRAMPTTDGFRPYRIEVYQRTDPRVRHFQTWYYDQATPYVDFSWNQVPTNVAYRVEITWRDSQNNEKLLRLDRRLGYYGLQETYFNYWTTW